MAYTCPISQNNSHGRCLGMGSKELGGSWEMQASMSSHLPKIPGMKSRKWICWWETNLTNQQDEVLPPYFIAEDTLEVLVCSDFILNHLHGRQSFHYYTLLFSSNEFNLSVFTGFLKLAYRILASSNFCWSKSYISYLDKLLFC